MYGFRSAIKFKRRFPMPYTGISSDALFLLSRNRHENSKAFYDAHKEQIKQQVFEPLAQLIEALSDDFAKLDPAMQLLPAKMMSRVRRDTRFTKEKHMYRDNVWVMFMRPKDDYPFLWPCFWFEVRPAQGMFSCGVCPYDQTPKFMQFLRERMDEGFLKAANIAIKAGIEFECESYKKDRAPDAPKKLKPYLNAKTFMFKYVCEDLTLLESDAIVEHLREKYKACHAMYAWLQKAAEEYLAALEH